MRYPKPAWRNTDSSSTSTMKKQTLVWASLLACVTGCSPHSTDSETRMQIPTKISADRVSIESTIDKTNEPQPTDFDIVFGGLKMAATIDGYRNVTIMNYPDEWQGNMSLIRFSGNGVDAAAFSPEHCEAIRNMASYGTTLPLIRGAYHSVISFEMPPFMSDDFMSAVRESAKAAGVESSGLQLNNPIHHMKGIVEISFGGRAISSELSDPSAFYGVLNLSQNGFVQQAFRQTRNC